VLTLFNVKITVKAKYKMSIALHFGLTTQSKLHGRNYIEANEANASYLN